MNSAVSSTRSWLTTTSAGSALLLGSGLDAQTFVQITLNTGSDNLNQIDTVSMDPQFNLDFTGDGLEDLILSVISSTKFFGTNTAGTEFSGFASVLLIGATVIGGAPFRASAGGGYSGTLGLFGSRNTFLSANRATINNLGNSSFFATATFSDFVPIQFLDTRLQAGPVAALLHVSAEAFAGFGALEAEIRFNRVVFDLDDLNGGNLGSADLFASYDEAQIIPEATSSLGLLALGAAGVLARRRRKSAA